MLKKNKQGSSHITCSRTSSLGEARSLTNIGTAPWSITTLVFSDVPEAMFVSVQAASNCSECQWKVRVKSTTWQNTIACTRAYTRYRSQQSLACSFNWASKGIKAPFVAKIQLKCSHSYADVSGRDHTFILFENVIKLRDDTSENHKRSPSTKNTFP